MLGLSEADESCNFSVQLAEQIFFASLVLIKTFVIFSQLGIVIFGETLLYLGKNVILLSFFDVLFHCVQEQILFLPIVLLIGWRQELGRLLLTQGRLHLNRPETIALLASPVHIGLLSV